MHVPKFAYRYARFACRRTRGEMIVDNGSRFLKTQKLALPRDKKRRRNRVVKEKKKQTGSMRLDAFTTMIIASCSFHGTAHDHPKISICNGISFFRAETPLLFGEPFFDAVSLFRLSSFGHWLSVDDRARVAAYFDIARSKNHIYLIVVTKTAGGSLTFFTG